MHNHAHGQWAQHIGFTCLSKVKRGTALAIVFGWWAVFTLTAAALGAAFS
jgi:hypothetical protein